MIKVGMKWIWFIVTLFLSCGAGFGQSVYATITEGSVSGTDSIAIGNASATSKDYATALGANATAGGVNSVAIGGSEKKAATGNIAATTGASAFGDSSIAIGDNSSAGGTSAVALGHKAGGLTNFSVAIGYNSTAKTSESTTAVGSHSISTGIYASSFASYAKAYTDYSLALGYKATVGFSSSMTLSGLSGIAIGRCAVTSADYGVALGAFAQAVGLNSVAIGGNDKAGAGNAAYAQGKGAIAVGNQAQATAENAIALGVGSKATANSIALGQGSLANVAGTVSVGSSETTGGFTRKIVNVTDGSSNTDAATYGQLLASGTYDDTSGTITFATHSGTGGFTVTGLPTSSGSRGDEKYSGDGKTIEISTSHQISVKADGKVVSTDTGIVTGQTVYNAMVTSGSYSNGTLTFTNGAGNTAFMISGISGGGGTSYTGDDKTISISDSDQISLKYDTTDLTVGDNGLTIKKDGKVENGNESLVTGGTVYEALQSMDNQAAQLSDDINKVGAGAAALAALYPEDGFNPDDKWSFALGYGHYKNANAGALGVFFKPNADTMVSLGGTIGNGDPMMNAGVSFKLGSQSKKAWTFLDMRDLIQRMNRIEAAGAKCESIIATQAKEIRTLRADSAAYEKRIAQLEADNAKLQQQVAFILSGNALAIKK